MEWWCGVASRWRRSAAAVRAKCGCGPAGGSRPQMAPADGGDGFSRVRPASLCSLARERCVVWAQLIFEVRAVRQSSDCVLWRMVPLGATLLSTHSAAATAGGTASGMAEIGRVKLQFAAARHGTAPLGTILDSTPFSLRVSTDTLRCCFSAAVCVYAMCRAFGPAQKLPPAVAEASAKSSACGRGALGF